MLQSPAAAGIPQEAVPFPEERGPTPEEALLLGPAYPESVPVRLEPQDPPEQGHRPPF